MFILALSLAHAGAFNDWTGDVDLPKNSASIAIDSVEGDIEITVDPEARHPRLTANDFRPGRACTLDVTKDKRGRTQVSFGPKDKEDASECRADFALVLPPTMDAKIELDIGEIVATGMSGSALLHVGNGGVLLKEHAGSATVHVGRGDVELAGVTGMTAIDVERGRVFGRSEGPVRALVGDGKIELRDLTAGVQADTGVGDILLAWKKAPTDDLVLNAGNGHVVVDLPNDTAVAARMSSMTGTTTCELPEGDAVAVVAVAGMGSVRVH